MLETAELGTKVSKRDYEAEVPKLRLGLLACLKALREIPFPVIVVLSGDDARGCNLAMNVLHDWMDPRYLEANAFPRASREEKEHPFLWRYWNSLPPRGKIGIFIRGWTKEALSLRLRSKIRERDYLRLLDHIVRFEEDLVADGALLLKFWVHLPPAAFDKRLKAPKREREDVWGLTRAAVASWRTWEKGRSAVEEVLRRTGRGAAMWQVVDGSDDRARDLAIGRALLDRLRARIAATPAGGAPEAPPARVAEDPDTVLDRVDLAAKADPARYDKALRRGQADVRRLAREAREKGLATVLVFEGWDAAGKGGAIRRLTTAMDAAWYRVHNISAPNDEERARHYLWRFWRRLPRSGHVAIFDRSWYGRVLVERVEGFATEAAWRRSYAEINDFEDQILDAGTVLLKFWLHIDADEQLRRFRAREEIAFKNYKITPEDYRNRDRWFDYEAAAAEMLARTHTERAPWAVIPAVDKKYARLEVLRRVVGALAAAVD